MRKLGYFNPEQYVRAINWFGIPVLLLYLISMFVLPWFFGSWDYVQSVWRDWQGLNVGMLALLSSVIAFNMSRYNDERQRERDFASAKAFLPESLSELMGYMRESGTLISEVWEKRNSFDNYKRVPLESRIPNLPKRYKVVFAECIKVADPSVGQYLAYILTRLQIHHARMKELKASYAPNSGMLIIPDKIVSYAYCLGELTALVNRLFDYARGLEEFNGSHLVWEDFHNAYANLDIYPDQFDDLIGFTKRAIGRKQSGNDT